ncbi:hypothetical protein ABZ783_04170 [Micromonospora sp. NPDC047738]|uniref:hypothetical protein n=1 Tax=Micromonospora sp. NPDC047738 TaxID=3155741 RepID=UPI0033EA8524
MSVKNRLIPSALGRSTASRAAVCAVAVGAAVFGLPSPSWADDNYYGSCSYSFVACQTGVEVSPPTGVDWCKSKDYAADTQVCIKFDGDIVYVKDGKSDGHSAMGWIGTPYAGSLSERFCRNPHGAGTWAKCNFDWVEDTTKDVMGGIRKDSSTMDLYPYGAFYDG